jgi:hypothetical protein
MVRACMVGIALGIASHPALAVAQLRAQREPFDWTGLAVVFGLFVIGIAAYVLARGRT